MQRERSMSTMRVGSLLRRRRRLAATVVPLKPPPMMAIVRIGEFKSALPVLDPPISLSARLIGGSSTGSALLNSPIRTIAIIGGGFSGTTVAANLLRLLNSEPTRIVLIERSRCIARGVAYADREYKYLLN